MNWGLMELKASVLPNSFADPYQIKITKTKVGGKPKWVLHKLLPAVNTHTETKIKARNTNKYFTSSTLCQ